jgi:hypothetical protein
MIRYRPKVARKSPDWLHLESYRAAVERELPVIVTINPVTFLIAFGISE